MLLYIIRHGDPDYKTDSLTQKGAAQAEAVGKRLFDSGIQQIYSSPMGRARQTAAPACRLLGLPCQIEPWAHEIPESQMSSPAPSGTALYNFQNTCFLENGNVDISRREALTCPHFNESQIAEAVEKIRNGGRDFLERLGYREEKGIYRILHHNEDKVALFCHAAMARTWISLLLNIPTHIMWASFSITHTGVTILEFKNNPNGITAPQCLCYSDLGHLYKQELEMSYNNKLLI